MIRRLSAEHIAGAWFFLVLVIAVSVQHRVAEVDFNDDVGSLLANADVIDGDELSDRLLLTGDIAMPEPPRQTAEVRWSVPALVVPGIRPADLPSAPSRAPPLSLRSI